MPIGYEWVEWGNYKTTFAGRLKTAIDHAGLFPIWRRAVSMFGSRAHAREVEYAALIEQGVGTLETMGWDLSDPPDEGLQPALKWLSEQIALARAPYGATAFVLSVFPLDDDLQTPIGGVKVRRLRPFKKEQWKEIKPLAGKWMKKMAALSPVGAVGTHLFNFGDVILAEMNNRRKA